MSKEELRIQAAASFAFIAHARVGQVREYTGEPYINHPAEVASIVESVPHTPEMVTMMHVKPYPSGRGRIARPSKMAFGNRVTSVN